jgi:hypothetical protein
MSDYAMDDIPRITFAVMMREPVARLLPDDLEIVLPRTYLSDPQEALAWLTKAQPAAHTHLSRKAMAVAGALLHTGCVTLRELEEGSAITWTMLFVSDVPWLHRLAKLYGAHITAGGAVTTLVDLLQSPYPDIRVFAQTLVHRVPPTRGRSR